MALFFAGPANAASCVDIANDLAEELSANELIAEVLAVQKTDDGCKVKLKLPAQNGKQSRIVTKTVSN